MSSLVARIGRDHQRYEDNLRLVSGCIPYKLIANDADDQNSDKQNMLKVLMLSSPNRDDLVFPKGGWEDDETVEEAASREAMEEAGVKGILKETLLGIWEFRSKSSQEICSLEGGCRGYMFAMEVTEELEIWPEKENRSRIWLSIKEASELCRYDWMRKALENFSEVMAHQDLKHDNKEETVEMHHPADDAVSDDVVVADCQIMSANGCIKTLDSSQHCSSIAPPITDLDLMCMCS